MAHRHDAPSSRPRPSRARRARCEPGHGGGLELDAERAQHAGKHLVVGDQHQELDELALVE